MRQLVSLQWSGENPWIPAFAGMTTVLPHLPLPVTPVKAGVPLGFGGNGVFACAQLPRFTKRLRQLVLLVCFLFIFSFRLFAHPHIFIDSYVTFVFEKDMLKGMQISWVWDEMWGQQVVMDCDKNLDNEFNFEELAIVEKEYFGGIKDYDYFMKIMIGGKPRAVPEPVNFDAKIAPVTQRVTYDFFIPLNIAVSAGKSIKVVFDDETIYTAFSIKPGMLKIKGDDIVTSETSVERYKYYGCVMSFNVKGKQ